jgi:hypothetical protein
VKQDELRAQGRHGLPGGCPDTLLFTSDVFCRIRRAALLCSAAVMCVGLSPAGATETTPHHAAKSARVSEKAATASDDGDDSAIKSADTAEAQDMGSAARAQALDKVYGYKGWNITFPSFADTVVQDDGYWRTRLASYGFGFHSQNSAIFQGNILNTPRRVPREGFLPCTSANIDYNCAGGRSYFGQRPEAYLSGIGLLTYDMSQWGVPDGQIAAGVHYAFSTDEQFSPTALRAQSLSWYQTLFDGKVEVKAGYFPSLPEFAGTFVGGVVTSPFGPAASVPVVLGLSPNGMGTPNFRATWHLNEEIYAQTGIQRSLPVNGPTGNPIYDEERANPSGLDFNSSVPGTGVLFTNEVGYKTQASPGNSFAWFRGGLLYNNSEFRDYSRLLSDPHATRDGGLGVYLLADYQIWQSNPSSPLTAYQGIYIGGTFMYGEPEVAAFTQYYEARAYWFAPFESRPRDLLSVIYSHNEASKYVKNAIDSGSAFTNMFAINASNSITASYMANIKPGLYATVGVGYTDKPSLQYFKGEGSSFNLMFSVYALF